MGEMEQLMGLRTRAHQLEVELKSVNELLETLGDGTKHKSSHHKPSELGLPPPSKSGHLFKWQDRQIGFGGSKWALRFVKLDMGRLAYYYSHLENHPRYVLSLRGCAIRDEGWKRNKRYQRGEDPPLEETGAYFFVFSIYYRPDSSEDSDDTTSNESIVPLLRLSTTSMAEHKQWMSSLSEACAYCETDEFLVEEAQRNREAEHRRQEQLKMIENMPSAERGTLAPILIVPDSREQKKRASMRRFPSHAKLPKSTLFRTTSKSRDADKIEHKGYAPSKPMHRTSGASYLSPEAKKQNYRGFFNLAFIILIVSNFRLLLSSIGKHGFFLSKVMSDMEGFSYATWDQFPLFSGILMLQGFLIMGFCTERLLAYNTLNETLGTVLHHLNAHSCLAGSIYIVWYFMEEPKVGMAFLMNGVITWMKLLSYAHANQDYRLSSSKKEWDTQQASLAIIDDLDSVDIERSYPENITLGNIYYFWLAPTLTYQIAFPKAPRVRPLRVVGILIRMVVAVSVFTFLASQTIAPNLANLIRDLEANDGKYTLQILAEYWLKLTMPNIYMWLLVFYFYFHLYLNLFAEVLRFGDRVFYKDWWNSAEVSAYWRLWNLPGKSDEDAVRTLFFL